MNSITVNIDPGSQATAAELSDLYFGADKFFGRGEFVYVITLQAVATNLPPVVTTIALTQFATQLPLVYTGLMQGNEYDLSVQLVDPAGGVYQERARFADSQVYRARLRTHLPSLTMMPMTVDVDVSITAARVTWTPGEVRGAQVYVLSLDGVELATADEALGEYVLSDLAVGTTYLLSVAARVPGFEDSDPYEETIRTLPGQLMQVSTIEASATETSLEFSWPASSQCSIL